MAQFKVGDLIKIINSPEDIGIVIHVGEVERLVELENNAEWRTVPAVTVKWIDSVEHDMFDHFQWWQLEVICESR